MKEHIRVWRNNSQMLSSGLAPRSMGAMGDALNMFAQLDEQQQKIWTELASRGGVELPYKALGGQKEFHHYPVSPHALTESETVHQFEEMISQNVSAISPVPESSTSSR